MPVYNAERYVGQAIESILSQTFEDFEFIILDDGSTDASLKILKEYAAKDKRIRLISRENQGVIRTRNELLEQSIGEYVAVMDADDIALPERFALQVKFLQANPNVVCVGGVHDLIDEKGRFLTRLPLPQHDQQIQQLALAGHGSICNPCAMIRRAALIQIGGYDETLACAEDLDVWLKLGEIGELANLENTVLRYRLLKSSISEQNGVLQRQAAREICERAWLRRGIEGYFEAEEPWRPTKDAASQHRFMLQYGWWAFNSGQRGTASLYGIKAITVLPFAAEGWKLLTASILKPLPEVVQKA
ncbi:MAG: glycosyltransferase family 2 protein [Leptolyngbyaceae cyanobacterium CRU_2_3]|nr:glycosyltransferase family 2 protein [Leptolyngbyaceae cyanobacterium CRU_2_3]